MGHEQKKTTCKERKEPNSQTENGKEARQMKEKVAMIQLTLLGDTSATELSTSALIGGDGANQCNMGHENARKMLGGEEKEGKKVV